MYQEDWNNHVKKIAPPPFFEGVVSLAKTFELRREDDVRYEVGDIITLREWEPERGYTGREIDVEVTYVLRDYPGIEDGWCIMSIRPVATAIETPHFAWWQDDYTEFKWSNKPDLAFRCTNCGHRAGKYKHKTYKYCPWCGAYMNGDAYVAERSAQTTIADGGGV